MVTRRILDLEVDRSAHGVLAGSWIAALEECRHRTHEVITNDVDLEREHPLTGNSTGTLLYHIAAIEADWLYAEVLETPLPSRIVEAFPWDVRDRAGRLTPVNGSSLEEHRQRLDRVRQELLAVYREMDDMDMCRRRSLPQYDVSPLWVAHHLVQHESGHRSEIEMLQDMVDQERS